MNKSLDLQAKFNEFIALFDDPSNAERQMMAEAFTNAAFLVARDSVDTLLDFGTAMAGLDVPLRTMTEGYDNAAENLFEYHSQVIKEVK